MKSVVDFLSWVGVALMTLLPIVNPVSTAVLLLGIRLCDRAHCRYYFKNNIKEFRMSKQAAGHVKTMFLQTLRNLAPLASGIYFYRLNIGVLLEQKKWYYCTEQ